MEKRKVVLISLSVIIVILAIFLIIMITNNKKNITYNVIFDSNGGSVVNSQVVNKGEKVIKPIDPTKEGYIFSEWTYLGQPYDFNKAVVEDLTLTAKWLDDLQEETYVVTFDSDGGTVISNQTITKGEKIERPADPTKDGYVFKGWTLNNEEYDFEVVVESNIELKAIWEKVDSNNDSNANKYVVTFNSNGGSAITNQTVVENNKVIKPGNPTRKGYTFIEWTLNGKTYDFNSKVTNNITLTANWKKTESSISTSVTYEYVVTFNSNGGSSVASKTVKENNKVAKPSNPTRKGYTFTGWTLNGKTYDFNSKVTNNITLVANWERNLNFEAPTLEKELSEPTTLGYYMYYLSINNNYYYNKYGDSVTMGYEIYEKNGSNYTKVGESGIASGSLPKVKIEVGTSKTYVARVYGLNSKNEKVYSGYSKEMVINHSSYEAPKMTSEFLISELELGKYTYSLNINMADFHKKYGDSVTMGYEIYEKNGSNYTKIGESGIASGSLPKVKIEVGTSKTYVARVYGLNSKNVKIYSPYSSSVTIDHRTYEAPVLTSSYQGNNVYSLNINIADFHKKYGDSVTMGYEIYEKNGNSYTKVGESGIASGAIIEVSVDSGSRKNYVARVYGLNSKGERIYGSYSNELPL